jgi:hypothetical protein
MAGLQMAELKEIYERYLAEEAAIRIPNVNLADRGWFHLCVLQCAIAWSRHPRANFRIGRGRHFFVLHFEGPVEGKPVIMFSFRSAVETGEYLFASLSPSKLPQGLSPMARASLARLRDLYEAALPQSYIEDGTVTVVIRKQPQIDFLPIVDEARRVLDDGNQEFAPVDLSQITLPTEKAALFVGKTTITPSPKRRIRHVPAPVPKPETHVDDDAEESDRGNFLAAQSHRDRPDGAVVPPASRKAGKAAKAAGRPKGPSKPPKRTTAPKAAARPKVAKAGRAQRPAKKAAKGGKQPGRANGRPRDRRAG